MQEAPKAYRYPDLPDNPSPNAPFRQGEPRPLPREEKASPSGNELAPLNRPNMTMDGEEGINPWDIEPTEYDLMYEDPDLYDFIADWRLKVHNIPVWVCLSIKSSYLCRVGR